MKKKLLNNWSLKLLSFVAAFFIWLSVTAYSNPISDYTISNIPIEFENQQLVAERGMSVEIIGKQVATISVRVSRSTYYGLSANDFKAVADFSEMYQDTQVPVRVTCMTNKVSDSAIDLRTRSVEVKLEPIVEVTVPVVCEISGEPASGYALGTVATDPESLVVKAPESVARLVKSAVVRMDVSGISETTTADSAIEFYDGNGLALDLQSSKDTTISYNGLVRITANVMAVQSVAVTAKVNGMDAVANGYRYTGVEISEDRIKLSGLKADMNRVTNIEVSDVLDVTGASEDVVVEVDIRNYLPEGVTLYDSNHMITFRLKVEPLVQKTFVLSTDSLQVNSIPENLNYAFEEESVELVISGLAEDLEQLEQVGLQASVNLQGLGIGTHRVPVIAILNGNGYAQVGSSQVTVSLKDPALETEASTEESTESEESTEDSTEESTADPSEITAEETSAEQAVGEE